MLLTKARALEGRGRLDLAAQTWQQILMAEPNQPEALAGLAKYARQNGNTNEAKVFLDRLRRVNPADKAIAEIEAMRPAPQTVSRARLEEADRLARAQQFEQAMRIYREVFGDDPPAGGWAIAYYETLAASPGGWNAAVAGLEKFTQRYPESGDYKLSLGRILTYRPQSRQSGIKMLESLRGSSLLEGKAKQAWRQALLWEGANSGNTSSLRTYLARYPDAELQKLLSETPQQQQPESPKNLAQTKDEQLAYESLNAGNLREAEQRFQAILKTSPESSGAHAGLGFLRMKQESFARAMEHFQAAKAAPGGDHKVIAESLDTARFWNHMQLGTQALKAGRTEDAIREYKEALTIRPTSFEAQQGMAGGFMQAGRSAEASQIYDKIVRAQPGNLEAWRELIAARLDVSGPNVAMSTIQQMPAATSEKIQKSADYLALLAQVQMEAGQTAAAARTVTTVANMVTNEKVELSAGAQLRLGGLYLSQKRSAEAIDLYERVAALDPQNVVAWEGMLAGMIQAGREKPAFDLMQRMPKETYSAGLRRPGFLQTAALLHVKFGSLDTAEALLDKVLLNSGSHGPDVSTQLLLANVWLEQGRQEKAAQVLRMLIRTYPERPDVWKAHITALHKAKSDQEALAVARQIPSSVRAELESDTGFIGLLAAVSKDAGDLKDAVRLLRAMHARLEAEKQPIPASLLIQIAWVTLDSREDDRMLYSVLNDLAVRPDLTPEERRGTDELWSVWTRRRAELARQSGDLPKTVAILEAGVRLMPRDLAVRSALAGAYVEAGQTKGALEIYKRWQMGGATAVDYAAAIGAAMAERDGIANVWLQAGLQKYPTDAQLLSLAGQNAAAKGDLKKAELYWKVALAALKEQERRALTNPDSARAGVGREVAGIGTRTEDPRQSLGRLLAGGADVDETPPMSTATRSEAGISPRESSFAVPVRSRPNNEVDLTTESVRSRVKEGDTVVALPRFQKMSLSTPLEEAQPQQVGPSHATPPSQRGPVTPSQPEIRYGGALPSPRAALDSPPSRPSNRLGDTQGVPDEVVRAYEALQGRTFSPAQQQQKSDVERLEERLAQLEGRNAGFMTTGATLSTRNGEPGFEQRTLQEAEIAGSTVLGDALRLTVVARPTYLTGKTPDGDSTLRFGLLPTNSSFTSPSASGMGGEVQLSTDNFGLRVGSTPSGFLVRNWIGGFRFRPAGGPITLLASRDPIRDTIVSFAGARDPVTGQVFGAAMANTFSLLGNWGDDRSGFYMNGGYQTIRGTQIASNNRIDANTGAYWKALQLREGSLTLGLNLTAMRYEKNLRFFTVGHGGYFSPQRYFLFNVPLRWTGTPSNRLQYSVGASLGSQFVREDASPYFPTMPTVQGRTGPFYAEQTVTGANYNVEATMLYQVAPSWFLGTTVNANNARYYASSSATIFVRRSFGSDSQASSFGVKSIPDWKGTQPFRVQ
jgi:tetratricopeptide (TPR) repeat protein